MNKTIGSVLLIAGLAIFAGIAYYANLPQQRSVAEPSALPLPDSPAAKPSEPGVQHPLVLPALEKPLPALDTSDATMRNSIAGLWKDPLVEAKFQFKDFIRRVVATVDNLPRRKVAQQLMPVRKVDGTFLVTGANEQYTIAVSNAERYAPYVALMEAVDPRQLVTLYAKFYPLFQQAYEDLGYPQQYFNDRLVAVIDNLLAAPEVDGEVRLVRPKVFYLYAEPELEDASAGQKILIRMGRDNAARVKDRLRAIRAELTREPPATTGPR